MESSEIFVGLGLLLALGVGCQIVAHRMRLPAIVLLLPVGFAAGRLTESVDPRELFGTRGPTVGDPGRDRRDGLDPRGAGVHRADRPARIVAASTAATFAAPLAAAKVRGAEVLLPATFLAIVGTVTVAGLLAVPVKDARRLDAVGLNAGPDEPD